MSSPTISPGPALAAFLQTEFDALGTTRGAWCREAKIPDTTVIRWKEGAEPDMRNLRLVVDALPGRSLLDILVVTGQISASEKRKGPPQSVTPRPIVDVDFAIRNDPNLETVERAALTAFRRAWKSVQTGAVKRSRVRN